MCIQEHFSGLNFNARDIFLQFADKLGYINYAVSSMVDVELPA